MTNQIVTVHGVSHPVVKQIPKEADSDDPAESHQNSTQLYRDETAERLVNSTKQAKAKPATRS
ncbi:hypothetical protein [Aporhodopirellula aestuarii]|uniref:Uncharacterized protein n=1 Tax=Aporhodopirellula aestuarii TaxID=2950107 RepID=A0ABT0UBD4_9BACT|nr:hypothetical protein [Aporhodopirellula aestuarii]MCM2374223.1 hypothetical protein [Aporhodopirellula aestuarii]